MATSIRNNNNNNNNNLRLLSEDEQITVKPRRKSSASSSKANEINKKKVARRGMGVAKLERIINSDNNKTSSSPSSSLPPPSAFIPCTTIATSFAADHHHHHHPVAPVQLPFSKISGMMTGVHGGGGLSLQVPQQFFVHKMAMGINGHTAFYPNGHVSCVNVKGNCEELPSIPSDYCADCYKKKRGVRVTGNEMVFDGVNPSFQDSAHQGAKVVALHKKASTIGQGNHVVMEYEFFPAGAKNKNKNKTKTHQNNYQAAGCEAAAAASSSCLTTTTAATNGSSNNYIDLSLKLSY